LLADRAPDPGLGESTGADDGPHLGCLRAQAKRDARFPSFAHDTHGDELRDGKYYVQCLKKPGSKKGWVALVVAERLEPWWGCGGG
jgi:hypothetical protein